MRNDPPVRVPEPSEPAKKKFAPPPPHERNYELPVAWLLGRELIATLKLTLLYTAYGTKLDPRDWMHPQVFPSERREEALKYWKALAEGRSEPCDPPPGRAEAQTREALEREASEVEAFWEQTQKEFWFDYIADTGDGMQATYSIAYLCLSNLWVEELWQRLPPATPDGEENAHRAVKQEPEEGYGQKLPRGEFLFVGGDTTYHLADYASLANRFKVPFEWAYYDLRERLREQVGKRPELAAQGLEPGEHRRLIFGIPGNHDYYDMLDGFRRQFRHPVRPEPAAAEPAAPDDTSGPQLMIGGFRRCQESSYVALRLPFDWWLWGLDTEVGEVDARQAKFFKDLNGGQTPSKLIVATCSPTTVFGRYADPDDRKGSRAFLQLGLPRVFLPQPSGREDDEHPLEEDDTCTEERPRVLDPKHIRLDISGDVHQYARYWGPAAPADTRDAANPPRQGRGDGLPEFEPRDNYASVVSGLGGAFHHPSTTYRSEVAEAALYPPEDESRRQVAGEVFEPWNVIHGGYVWLIGALIAFIIYFAATYVPSAREYWSNSFFLTRLHVTEEVPLRPTLPLEQPRQVEPFAPWTKLGLVRAAWLPADAAAATDEFCKELANSKAQRFFWGRCSLRDPLDYILGWVLAVGSLAVAGFAFWKTEKLYKKSRTICRPKDTPAECERKNGECCRDVKRWLWLLTALFAVVVVAGVLTLRPYRTFISPHGNSLLTLLSILWALAGAALGMRYTDWLFEQASRRHIPPSDWWITWMLGGGAVLSLAAGLWLFGQNNLPAYLAVDILFTVVVALVGLLAIYLAVAAGGVMLGRKGKAGMFLVGVWHAALQLLVPFLLVRKGTWPTLLLAAALVLFFMKVGEWLMKENRRGWLVAAWFLYGALMFLLPAFVLRLLRGFASPEVFKVLAWPHVPGGDVPGGNWPWEAYLSCAEPGARCLTFAGYEWWNSFQSWWGLVPSLLAAGLGAVLCCAWFGWYLGVCLGFNGHNNEAGGAARIERFKQFIRFRITETDITGYVIAVDDPEKKGSELKPRLVDVFRLTAEKSETAATPAPRP